MRNLFLFCASCVDVVNSRIVVSYDHLFFLTSDESLNLTAIPRVPRDLLVCPERQSDGRKGRRGGGETHPYLKNFSLFTTLLQPTIPSTPVLPTPSASERPSLRKGRIARCERRSCRSRRPCSPSNSFPGRDRAGRPPATWKEQIVAVFDRVAAVLSSETISRHRERLPAETQPFGGDDPELRHSQYAPFVEYASLDRYEQVISAGGRVASVVLFLELDCSFGKSNIPTKNPFAL